MVVNPRTAHVCQRDPIFSSGGILTIGLKGSDPQYSGIYWSLPLAHLRHYGAPVISSQSIDSVERSRISTEELLLATLGCLLHGWDDAGSDTMRVITWLENVLILLEKAASGGLPNATLLLQGEASSSWFTLMLRTARKYLNSSGVERNLANKLISLGRKHGRSFLGKPTKPVFGLLRCGSFVSLIVTENDKIHYLRQVAQEITSQSNCVTNQMIIRYRHRYVEWDKEVYEYATALPWIRETSKRKHDKSVRDSKGHKRWLYSGGDTSIGADEPNFIHAEFQNRKRFYCSIGEDVYDHENELIKDIASSILSTISSILCTFGHRPSAMGLQKPSYIYIYGDEKSAAIYVIEGIEKFVKPWLPLGWEATQFYSLFETKKISAVAATEELIRTFRFAAAEVDPYLRPLKAISTAANMYQRFTNSSVDIRVLQQSLSSAGWVKACSQDGHEEFANGVPHSLRSYRLSRENAFACITMFESGKYDIAPEILENVIAMSSEDTIYVSGALLTDPSEQSGSESIKRILGNIGRPGIAFLVPPLDPLIREVKMSDWPRISREKFDGEMRDSFGGTSLHLSFTGASTPVNVGFSGGQDIEVYMLETLISVHDGGNWIADLNVFKMFESTKLRTLRSCQEQAHNCAALSSPVTTIDNWFELIDAPEEYISLVRAYKNWQARLAATTLSLALGYETLVVPEKICWQCFDQMSRKLLWEISPNKVIVIS